MTISEIEIWDFRPAFRDGPYAMSHVTNGHAYGRFMRVHDSENRCGVGEIVYSPSLPVPDREARIRDEESYLSPLIGQPFEALLTAASTMRTRDKSWRGIAFALETAWFDREGHRTGKAMSALFGGTKQPAVPDYFSISESEISKIRARMDVAGTERQVLQLKLGVGSLDKDVGQVAALLTMMAEHQVVQADANGGWTVNQACEIIARFDDDRLIWEEPCTTYEDNVRVAERTGKHVMVDQCVGSLDMALRAIDERVAQSLCIKPAPLGGLIVARQVRDRAIEANMLMRIDGPWCGDIASAAILHLAVGTPKHLLLAGCDLREPLAIPINLSGIRSVENGRIAPPDGNGVGVTVLDGQLGPPDKSISA